MNRRFLALVLGLSICSLASAGQRLALIVGNADYEGAKLDLSLNDVEKALTNHGFQVIRRENLKAEELKTVSAEFVSAIPTNGIGLFYFAGLGATIDRNGKPNPMLRPVDQVIKNEGEYRKFGLNLAEFAKRLEEDSGARSNWIVVDVPAESTIKPEDNKVVSGIASFEAGTSTRLIVDGKTLDSALASLGENSSQPSIAELREGAKPGETFTNSVGMVFQWCPPGQFTMGTKEAESPDSEDRKAVDVSLSKGFWLGTHEVTQLEYERVVRRTLPNEPGFFGKNLPWWGITEAKAAADFCKKLSEMEHKSGALPKDWEYVCPTEAEWEYACRAGSSTTYHFGDSVEELGRYANFADRTLRESSPSCHWADPQNEDGTGKALAEVGSYLPNAWGLHDMHGNVAEIVADHYAEALPGGTDPLFQVEKDGRFVLRGGAWCSIARYCESSFRNISPRKNKTNFVGFRIALKKVK